MPEKNVITLPKLFCSLFSIDVKQLAASLSNESELFVQWHDEYPR